VSVHREEDRSPIALWDTFWSGDAKDLPASPVVRQIVRRLGPKLAGARVLEIGAGTGRDIVALARAGARAYADDRSSAAREKIAQRAAAEGVTVELCDADLRALPYPDEFFDVVYSVGVVEHFTAVGDVLREQRRIVRSGGMLIVDVPQTFNPWTLYKHLCMWRGRWAYGWETQYSLFDLRRFAREYGLRLKDVYWWGEHLTRLAPLLDVFDHTPLTAMCIGGVYEKA